MHPNIKILSWFNFLIDFKLYAPIAILYFAQISGSFALGMSVFTIAVVSAALFEIPTGIFSDRIGRKKTIVLGALFAVAFTIFYAVGLSYWYLVIGALFEGLTRSLFSGNNDALLHETLAESGEESKYAQYLGSINKMFQIALGISAVIAIVVIVFWSFKVLFWLSVIPQIMSLILVYGIKEPKIHLKESGNIYLHLKEAFLGFRENRKLRLVSLTSMIGHGFGEATYTFQSAFYATVWPVWAIPIAKILSNIGAATSFHYAGRIIKKYNVFKLLFSLNLYSRSVTILAAAFPTIFSPLLMSSTSLVFGVGSVAKSNIMQQEFKPEQRATMGSLNEFGGSMVFGVVALSLGLLADNLSPAAAFLVLQGFNSVNLLVYFKLIRVYGSDKNRK